VDVDGIFVACTGLRWDDGRNGHDTVLNEWERFVRVLCGTRSGLQVPIDPRRSPYGPSERDWCTSPDAAVPDHGVPSHPTTSEGRKAVTISVFLLDDHEIVRRGIAQLLESEDDIEVIGEAGTAAQALARIPRATP
jgi:hypothetical protein